ncbi:MAG: FAD-dependent oxidoreductase [Thermoplasmata archaeon]
MSKKILIVGGGIAGVTAAEAARKISQDAPILLIHDEPGLPYNRLNLTLMIAGEVSPDEMEYKSLAWYDEKNIEHIHDSVTGIDRASKTVTLKGAGKMDYGALILATGASPFVPPIPGIDKSGVSTLRTLAQARDIISNVRDGTGCICIGGGLLGIELAVGLSKRGARVTILEGNEWLLSRQLAPRAGAILKSRIEALGLKVRCGVKVAGITGNGKVAGVILAPDENLAADMVLISAGVRPDMKLAAGCGLEVGRGLKVDDSMRTSDGSIFAAGDVTEHNGIVYGLWPAALEQGRVAGANAAGGTAKFEGMAPSAFLKVVGVDVFSTGDFNPKDEGATVIEREEAGNYARLVLRDGVLTGANLVGDTTAALPVKSAVAKAKPVAGNERLLKLFPELAPAQG